VRRQVLGEGLTQRNHMLVIVLTVGALSSSAAARFQGVPAPTAKIRSAERHRDFLATVRAGVNAGGSAADEVASRYQVPAKYSGYGADHQRVKVNEQAIFDELKR